ncbi:hypothetical protein [Rhodococcus sp. ACS1]|uniref:hypothetical protein n=1 Tax=Rhodococcus sp. ACS1 TaxID=2028570 RepID=UPI00117B4EDC|nr:hypothetical protein [Rhodococcus sp. ACS1]
MKMISGTEIAMRHPNTAARVVIRAAELGGDVQNAWDVLVSAVGTFAARELVVAEAKKLGKTEYWRGQLLQSVG